ncbi:MAG: hypothetical protein KJ971_06475 [Firmicutes bacterium]|nr:hypothetical protein [Bacillota bacterium]
MRAFMEEWKKARSEFGLKKILDAFFGGWMFSSLIFIPIYIILGEALLVYMYLLYTIVVLMILVTMGYVIVFLKFSKKALLLKKPESQINLNKIFFKIMLYLNGLVLLIGLIFILFIIPRLLV